MFRGLPIFSGNRKKKILAAHMSKKTDVHARTRQSRDEGHYIMYIYFVTGYTHLGRKKTLTHHAEGSADYRGGNPGTKLAGAGRD